MVNELIVKMYEYHICDKTRQSINIDILVYLDKICGITTENVEFVCEFIDRSYVDLYLQNNFTKIIDFIKILKKYSVTQYNSFIWYIHERLIFLNMVKKFIEIIDLLDFNVLYKTEIFDKSQLFFTLPSETVVNINTSDIYVTTNMAQLTLMYGSYDIYEHTKARYTYTKEDLSFMISNLICGESDIELFFNKFIEDQGITGDDLICYSLDGQKITVYEKLVEIYETDLRDDSFFWYLAPRVAYPIVKMIPDIGRVTLLDDTHAYVQTLADYGIVEKHMIYTIIDGRISLITDKMEANW